jgi:flagellar biosynthesis/type III secretory pathway protein FliH
MSNKQQTAVDWLVEQLPLIQQEGLRDIIEQADEMFEQQIKDACQQGFYDGLDMAKTKKSKFKSAEQYYNETFNN